jgi:hypothetical protein
MLPKAMHWRSALSHTLVAAVAAAAHASLLVDIVGVLGSSSWLPPLAKQ